MLSAHWPYLSVFAVLLLCGLGLPLPEDIPLLFGGWVVFEGQARLFIMIAVGIGGVLAGDCILFSLGRRFGHQILLHRFLRRLVNLRRLQMAERLFQQHGVKIIFIGRFLPGLRAMLFMAAGVLRVRPLVFLAVNGTAACISVPLLVGLGYYFGHKREQLASNVRTAGHVIGLVVVVAITVAIGIHLHRRQKRLMASASGEEGEAKLPAVTDADTAAPAGPASVAER